MQCILIGFKQVVLFFDLARVCMGHGEKQRQREKTADHFTRG